MNLTLNIFWGQGICFLFPQFSIIQVWKYERFLANVIKSDFIFMYLERLFNVLLQLIRILKSDSAKKWFKSVFEVSIM